MKYHVASIAERHNYAECYTQEIINEARISFARILGLQPRVMLVINTIYFFSRRIYIKMEFSSQREIPWDSDNHDFGIH